MLTPDWSIQVSKKHVRYDVECDGHTLHATVSHDRALAYINADLWCVCTRARIDVELLLNKRLDYTPPQLEALTDTPVHRITPIRIHDPP